ncbi:MAG: hypothetical protein HN590_13725 [Calditrichaeota bacterium]|nr:hypothetical protein [Calditrichota bacterium]
MFDYQSGALTFTPTKIVDSNSRIEVEFEYNDSSYPHYLYAGRVGSGNGCFNFEASTIVEGLDKDNPLVFEWNDDWKQSVRGAGDDDLGAIASGVETVEPGKGDYVWGMSGTDSILVFSYPDSSGIPNGNLQVSFSLDSTGGYERVFDDILLAFYYKWIGEGTGNWSPVRHIPLPDRLVHNDVYAELKFGRVSLKSELAVSEYDRNVLSPENDGDNVGLAWNFAGNWGDQSSDRLSASFSTRRIGQDYRSVSKEKEADYNYLWNLGDIPNGSETAIETSINAKPSGNISINGSAGYLEKGDHLASQRTGLTGKWQILNNVSLRGEFNQTNSDNKNKDMNTIRSIYSGQFLTLKGLIKPGYTIRLEKSLTDIGMYDRDEKRLYTHDISLHSKPTDNDEIKVNFSYRGVDNEQNNINTIGSDSRIIQGGWKKNIRRFGGFEIDLLRSFTTTIDPEKDPLTATSAIINGMYRPRQSAWTAQFDYLLSTGTERTGAKVATFIGEGRGGWKREGDRYVPDPDGDFSIREVATDTLGRVSRAEINGRIQWTSKRKQSSNKNPAKFPLGISGGTFRLSASIATSESDPIKAFYFDPSSFTSDMLIFSERRIIHDLNFLEGNPKGDGRLNMRWNEIQDKANSGGERSNSASASFRIRRWLKKDLRLKIKPSWERNIRQGLTFDETRSDVQIGRGEFALEFNATKFRIESDLNFGYEERHDPTKDIVVIERDWKTGLIWKLYHSGSVRFDGQWLNLTSNRKSPGYDLDLGWEIGNNFVVSLNTDYNLNNNMKLTALYRGRWRGNRAPRHEGMIEMTVTL